LRKPRTSSHQLLNMVGPREAQAFHKDIDEYGNPLSPQQRERLLKPYLPPTPKTQSPQGSPNRKTTRFHHKKRLRPAVRHLIHSVIFGIVHTIFSIYVRVRQAYPAVVSQVLAVLYYHHRTPELIKRDVNRLNKIPKHLSVILQLPPDGGKKDRLETLVNDACEIAAWSASAGVPVLSIYERTGKRHDERRV
jgi:dehydrodolichyl diphosphate syntase complex subunit NUS1